MSFASSYFQTVTIDKYGLSGAGYTSGAEITVYSQILPKGNYFISFCPTITTGGTLSLIACDIGTDLGGVDEKISGSWYGTPFEYNNMSKEQITLACSYYSEGILPLEIVLLVSSTTTWNYLNYDGSARNLSIMRLN